MRVAITGATGNVGTALLRRLAAEPDVEVVGLARRPPKPGSGAPYDGVEWHAVDIGDDSAPDRLAPRLEGVDAVVHLAWQIQPSHDRRRLWRTNVTGSRHVVESMLRAGVTKLVYASSVGAYAPGPKDRGVDETWPTTGVRRSSYSVDKVAVERMLDRFERERSRLRVVRMRTALVFQGDAGAEIGRFFVGPLVPRGLLRPGRVPVVPRNARLRAQTVHADDAAQAYLMALRREVTGAFNIAGEPPLDGALLAAELGARTVPVPVPVLRAAAALSWHARLQPTEPGWIDLAAGAPLMDCSRAGDLLGWTPKHDARATLRELLAGMAEGGGAPSPALRAAGRRLATGLPGHGNPG
ncbi:NAD-dependent epimerase/dehydratase family protein [Polymorphospora rubra]|uniref:NAD-dependent epimerase/dehydratase family protein n=1 Tax=Polymorphospora rubra TaxID=338584 RepID=UPI0033EB1359